MDISDVEKNLHFYLPFFSKLNSLPMGTPNILPVFFQKISTCSLHTQLSQLMKLEGDVITESGMVTAQQTQLVFLVQNIDKSSYRKRLRLITKPLKHKKTSGRLIVPYVFSFQRDLKKFVEKIVLSSQYISITLIFFDPF